MSSVADKGFSGDIYVYKMVVDNGGAPCVWCGLLSLALCKPKIRRSANIGSMVFGFGGKRLKERLIYIAEVTEKPAVGDYYRSGRVANRPDSIYEGVSGVARRKKTAQFHKQSDERRKDVGLKFQNAHVLLSRDFRYFGKRGADAYKQKFPALRDLVESLTQGHRRNHSSQVRSELLDLKATLWRKYRKMKIGTPTDADKKLRCNDDTPSVRC